MSNSSSSNLANALADVRRAYRLLWAFQKRLLDINRLIRDKLGFEHYYQHHQFNPVQRSTNVELRSGWDLLPHASLAFLSLRPLAERDQYPNGDFNHYRKAGDMMLVVWPIPDSALVDALKQNPNREPEPLKFSNPEQCKSLLHIALIVNDITRMQNDPMIHWYSGVFLPLKDCILFGRQPNDGPRLFKRTFNLTDLPDEDTLLKKAEDFQEEAEEKLSISLALT